MHLIATLNLLAQARQNSGGEEAAVVAMLMTMFGSLICVWICIVAFYVIIIAAGIASTAFWIWMLIDCIHHEQKIPEPDNQMTLWVLLIILTHGIGAAVYFFARKPYNRGPTHPQNPSKPSGF